MAEKIPYKVAEYLREHYREDFLSKVNTAKDPQGHTIYNVEITHDDYIHKLRFNENGKLIHEDTRPAFPADQHDEPAVNEAADPKDLDI